MNTNAAKSSKAGAAAKVPGWVPPLQCSLCRYYGPGGKCLLQVLRSGRCGDWVYYMRGSKQCRRRWAKPMDPKTPKQVRSRARLGAASHEYSEEITTEERNVAIAAGAKRQSRRRLFQSGSLTGQQQWVGDRCADKTETPAPQARTPKA